MELNSTDQKEADRIMHNLAVMPSLTVTCNKNIAKYLINLDTMFARGELYEINAKHRGVGIYKISLSIKT